MRLLDGATGIELFAFKMWLGTTTNERLVVLGTTRGQFAKRWRTGTASVDAVGDDGSRAHLWEDVAFYREGKACANSKRC